MVLLLSTTLVIAQNKKTYTIPFYKNTADVMEVDVSINDVKKRFIFDTGASTISFGTDFYLTLRSDSLLTDNDIISKSKVTLADGSFADALIINIKKLKIGDIKLDNVKATVIKKSNIPLLLGQSVFNHFGTVTIDNNVNNIIIKTIKLPKKNITIINELKFIPCSFQLVSQVEIIKDLFENDSSITVNKYTQEKNVPPPPITLKRIINKITIRFFDNNDQDKVSAIYDVFIREGYFKKDIGIENMVPYYNKPISNYIEIWIK